MDNVIVVGSHLALGAEIEGNARRKLNNLISTEQ